MKIIIAPNTPHQHVFAAAADTVTIGSAPDNDIVLTSCAAYHALLRRTEDGWRVRDIARQNDIYVDDELYAGNCLTPGTSLLIGTVELVLADDRNYMPMTQKSETALVGQEHEKPSSPYASSVYMPPSYAGGTRTSEPGVIARLAWVFALCGPLLLGVGWLIGGILAIVAISRASREPEGIRARRTALWALFISIGWIVVASTVIGFASWRHAVALNIAHNEKEAYRLISSIALAQYYVRYAEVYTDEDEGVKSSFVALPELFAANYRYPHGEHIPGDIYHGYTFTMIRADAEGFICIAVPRRYGFTGRMSYWVDERGIVYGMDLRGEKHVSILPLDAKPLHPDSLLLTSREELARDLARAAERAFEREEFRRTKRIITHVQSLFPETQAAARLSQLEQSADPFILEFTAHEVMQRAREREHVSADAALALYREVVAKYPTTKYVNEARSAIERLAISMAKGLMDQAEGYMNADNPERALNILRSIAQKYPEARLGAELKDRIAAAEITVNDMMEKAATALLYEAQAMEAAEEYDSAYSLYLSLKNTYGGTRAAADIDSTLHRLRTLIEGREAAQLIDQILQLDETRDASRILRLLDLLERGYARTDVYVRNQDMLTRLQRRAYIHTLTTAARDHLRQENYRAALAQLEKISELDADSAVRLKPELEESYLHMGDVSFESQDYRDAVMYYTRYLQLQPNIPRIDMRRLHESYLHLARSAFRNNDFEAAEEFLNLCAEAYAGTPEYEFMYGRVLLQQQKWEDALKRLSHTLDGADTSARDARLYWAFALYRHVLQRESDLLARINSDEDYVRIIANYGIVFDDIQRRDIPVSAQITPSRGSSKTFQDSAMEFATHIDLIAAEAEQLTLMDRSLTQQRTQQRTRIRNLVMELPSHLNVLRASASAEAHRKGRILEELREVHRQYQRLSTALNLIQGGRRGPDVARFQANLKDKVTSLSAAVSSLEMYTGLEEQRRRSVISMVERIISDVSPTTTNPNALKGFADTMRREYASTRETDHAVEGLRAFAKSYQIAPVMRGLLREDTTSSNGASGRDATGN